jgi:hypothetical protein
MDTMVSTITCIPPHEFAYYKKKLNLTNMTALVTVGDGAFWHAGTKDSIVDLTNSTLLEVVQSHAFDSFAGEIQMVGQFAHLADLQQAAFYGAANANSNIVITCVSEGGITVADDAFGAFKGIIPSFVGEQCSCSNPCVPLTCATIEEMTQEEVNTFASSVTEILPNAFSNCKKKLNLTNMKALVTVGHDAFRHARTKDSVVDLTNSKLLEVVQTNAFEQFAGEIQMVGPFAHLADLQKAAFWGAANANNNIMITCGSEGGITVAADAFGAFNGFHDSAGEQCSCNDPCATTSTTTTTTTTTTITISPTTRTISSTTITTITTSTRTTTTTTITTTTTTISSTTRTISSTTITTSTRTTTTTTITTTRTTVTQTTTTRTTVTQTTTTTVILPNNATCTVRNDQCDNANEMYCDRKDLVCRYVPATTTSASTRTITRKSRTLPLYAYAGIAVVGLVAAAFCAYRGIQNRARARIAANYTDDGDDDDDDGMLLLDGDFRNNAGKKANADYFDPQMTLKRIAVTFTKMIGEGNFGKVFLGTAQDPRQNGAVVPVAIKSPSADATIEFEAEMEIMSQLTRLGGHPHIVEVVGCVYGEPPLLVLEFCAGGSLKAALTAVRTNKMAPHPTIDELTTHGHQVALAMTFLEHHKLLHRDLAARNVLLTEHRACKLADFGLSRNAAGASNYYRRTAGKSAPMPVRWMAPETLDDNVSTIESDRWSFGVLLWEIYSQGSRPYAGVENYKIAQHVRKGRRLEQPELCPDAIYTLMQQCWSAEPEHRPPFAQVAAELQGTLAVSVV